MSYDYTDVNTGTDYTDGELEDVFEEWLDDNYDDVDIAGHSFSVGNALKQLDEIAFREAFNNWIDAEVQEGTYREYKEPECEDCSSTLTQDDVTEAISVYDRVICPSCALDEDADGE